MPSFGYQAGDGAGLNNLIFPLGPLASRFQNDSGGTVIVDTVTLLGVGTAISGVFTIEIYTDAPGAPYNRLASATRSGMAVGANDFDLSAHPVPIRDGEFVWACLTGPGNLRVDGINATDGSVRPLFANQDPFGIFFGQNLILPVQISGPDTWDASATDLRAADVLAEPVSEGASAIRAADVLAEPVTEGPSQLRTADILAEPVVEAASNLRCAIILVEALISVPEEGEMITDRLPLELGTTFESEKSPVFATQVRSAVSLRTNRNSLTPFPAYEFEVNFPYLPSDVVFRSTSGEPDLKRISGFFKRMHGRHGSFLYRDPQDHQVTGGAIGVGDGVTTEFKFQWGEDGFYEPVGQVDVDAGYTLYLDGAPIDPADFDFVAPNGISFHVAPDAPSDGHPQQLTGDFTFDFVCNFLADSAAFTQFNRDLFELRQLRFRADPP